ncbi:7TM diverse intracellular signaling domain-containing protein [Marinobacter sp.]|uniref:7TM diverse intracellular signaling domain-containing protein n=1 Tax=Marinobacter sp. TaxID=50741 RepID=UPI00384D9582
MQQQVTSASLAWLVALLLLAFSGSGAAAASANACGEEGVRVTDHKGVYDLASCLWYLEDPEHSLTLQDVRGDSHLFTRHQGGMLNFGYTDSAYWARFELRLASGATGGEWILELALPLVDEVELYAIRNGELVQESRTGYEDPWSERDLALPNPSFKLRLVPDTTTTVYLRVSTLNTFRLPLTLWKPDSYIENVSVEEAVRGVLLGSLLAILAYNLFVAVSVRERSNIYYVLYLVSAAVFIMTEQVHGIQLLDERPAFLDKEYLHYQIMMTWFWGLLMARALLETREKSPDLDQVLRLCLAGVVVSFVLSLFMPYHIAMEWIVIASIVLCITMIVVSYLSWRYYNPAARAYFFAWTAALTGFVIYAFTVMGYLPLNTFTAYSPQTGLTAQIILFSFALADRIKLVQAESLDWSKRALANLRRYQSLFDNAIEGVFQMSLERRFITANPAMADLLGYDSNRELISQNLDVLDTCFVDPNMRRWVVEQLEQRGTLKGVEARYVSRRGDERWATISLHTVYDSEGEPLHLEGTCIDATERHQRQRIEKEREQERMERDLARNSAAAKSQFLANMSHEIRTPLTAIIGYGETLLDPELTREEKRSSAETVVRSGRHLLDLVNDILDHSKIDANRLDVDIVSVNLPELLDEIRAFFQPRAREKGLEFSIVCEFPLPEQIQTDPTRLRQIIINLCGNALKFTEKGSISLMIRCERQTEQLVARVVDTGIGMEPAQLSRLFDPFAQGSAAIARQYGGTGLGLSISRRLTELLGGRISVHSTLGEGSEFEISIATGSLEGVRFLRDASEMTRRQRHLPLVKAPRLQGRILCAEDSEVNRHLVSLLVSRTGAEMVHVSNGEEVLEALRREHFDLILMDIQMPVMNGRDATAALREAGIGTPVVALTANVMSEDIDDYRLAGCTDHLAKPIDRQKFHEVLGRYLQAADSEELSERIVYDGAVLLADSDDDSRQRTGEMLSRLGLEVKSVTSGDEAVRAALASSFRLVFLDFQLPGMAGAAATRLLRQAGFQRPLIGLASGSRSEIDELTEAGCTDVLMKPVEEDQLVGLLSRNPLTSAQAREEVLESRGIERLVEQFLDGLAGRRGRMAAALARRDAMALHADVHQIKGTAGAMGHPGMTEQAGRVDQYLRTSITDWVAVRRELEQLNQIMGQALASRTDQRTS